MWIGQDYSAAGLLVNNHGQNGYGPVTVAHTLPVGKYHISVEFWNGSYQSATAGGPYQVKASYSGPDTSNNIALMTSAPYSISVMNPGTNNYVSTVYNYKPTFTNKVTQTDSIFIQSQSG